MLKSADEAPVGRVVYLYPHTKQASRACHEQRVVKIRKDAARHWPRVVVEWTQDGVGRWELVHADNIRLKPPGSLASVNKEKKEGDGPGSRGPAVTRVRVMPGRIKPIALSDDQEQGTLF